MYNALNLATLQLLAARDSLVLQVLEWLSRHIHLLEIGFVSKSLLHVKRQRGICELISEKGTLTKSRKHVLAEELYDHEVANKQTNVSIEAQLNENLLKKCCGGTGSPSNHTDLKKNLRFCSQDVFMIVRKLTDHGFQELLTPHFAKSCIKILDCAN